MRHGTKTKVAFHERLVLPRLKDVVQGLWCSSRIRPTRRAWTFSRLDVRDAFKQLPVVASERPYLAGAAMGGLFSYRTVLFGVGSGCPNQLFRGRPIIPLLRDLCRKAEVGHLSFVVVGIVGFETRLRKGVVRARSTVWIGTQSVINVNKIEIRLPTKTNLEILTVLSDLVDGPGSSIKHDVRRVADKVSWVACFLPQLKPSVRQLWASLVNGCSTNSSVTHGEASVSDGPNIGWCWRSTPARLEVEGHVGMVIEADHNASHLMRLSARIGLLKMNDCCSRSGETLRTEACMAVVGNQTLCHFKVAVKNHFGLG